jgi:hypothetical protein
VQILVELHVLLNTEGVLLLEGGEIAKGHEGTGATEVVLETRPETPFLGNLGREFVSGGVPFFRDFRLFGRTSRAPCCYT